MFLFYLITMLGFFFGIQSKISVDLKCIWLMVTFSVTALTFALETRREK